MHFLGPAEVQRGQRHRFQRLRHALVRLGAAEVIAAFPVRIELDRHHPDLEQADDIRMNVQPRPDNVYDALDEIRVLGAPPIAWIEPPDAPATALSFLIPKESTRALCTRTESFMETTGKL